MTQLSRADKAFHYRARVCDPREEITRTPRAEWRPAITKSVAILLKLCLGRGFIIGNFTLWRVSLQTEGVHLHPDGSLEEGIVSRLWQSRGKTPKHAGWIILWLPLKTPVTVFTHVLSRVLLRSTDINGIHWFWETQCWGWELTLPSAWRMVWRCCVTAATSCAACSRYTLCSRR